MLNDMPECDAPKQEDNDEILAGEGECRCEENPWWNRRSLYQFLSTFLLVVSLGYGTFLVLYHISALEQRNASTEKQLKELCDRLVKLTDQVTLSVEDTKAEIDRYMRPDFALESAGGRIVTTRDTKPYSLSEPTYLLGILPMCQEFNLPSTMINPSVNLGECWAFEGAQGSAVIKLMGKIRVTGVSIEHIPPELAPDGNINTAPKEFSLHGLSGPDEIQGQFLGKFLYKKDGTSLQYFKTNHQTTRAYDYVELKIHSNHGNPEYTCVYRVRIHGELESGREMGIPL